MRGGTGRDIINIRTDGEISCDIGNAEKDSGYYAEANKWIFVTLVHNDSGDDVVWYVNGKEYLTLTTFAGSVTGDWVFGNSKDLTSDPRFHGYIDEVKIYPCARTADQIKQDYNAGLSGVKSKSGVSASFGGTSDSWLSDGLVGYWKFDESATTSGAIDSSGNGNDGTYYGNASTTGGKFGNSSVFDGSGDYVDVGSDSSLLIGNNLTISFWFNKAADDNYQVLGATNSTGQDAIYAIEINGSLPGDPIQFWREDEDGTDYILQSNQVVGATPEDEWHHVVCIDNGSEMSMYVNGVKQNNTTNSSSLITPDSIGSFYIGDIEEYYVTQNLYDGQIDEVRIYNRALSKSEVKKLYEWAPGPVAHWKFDEKSGTTAFDSVASSSFAGGNDGTFYCHTGDCDYPIWGNGKYGSALGFDGVDGSVILSDNDKIETGFVTISAWIKPNESTENMNILGRQNDAYRLRLDSGNTLWAYFNTGTEAEAITSSHTTTANVWQHVAVVYDGDQSYFYLNGTKDTQATTPVTGMLSQDSTTDLYIGTYYGNNEVFDGSIDDVKIYNYARTQKQILEDMSGGGQASKYPVLHLSFDEGRGETVHDSSIHKNNGTAFVGTAGSQTATSSMWEKSGKVKGAMEFDGTDDRVAISNFQFSIFNQFSISQFFNFQTLATGEPIIAQWGNSQNSVLIKSDDTNSDEIKVCLADELVDNCTNYGVTVDANITADNWYGLQVVFDGDKTGNANRLKLYLNGEEKTLVFTGTATSSIPDSSEGLEIGGDEDTSTYSNIQIDEVKIWNYALSEDEIKQEYNSGASFVMGGAKTASDAGTTVTGASTEYCIPGDTATCTPPVLELKFDKKSGSTAYDTSGNGNDGTINGATHSQGKLGAGLSFDGSLDWVDTGSAIIPASDDFTLSAWIKPDQTLATDGGVFGQYQTGQSGRTFLFLESDVGGRNLVYSVDGARVMESTSVLNSNWHYVNITRSSNDYVMYINGVVADTGTDSTAIYQSLNTTIGQEKPLGTALYSFDGLIDDAKIYNYARTPAQIAYDYNKGKPIAHYKFDECSGSVIHDESGNGNHGTLNLGSSGVTATGTCASSSDSFWYNGRTGKKNSGGSFDGAGDGVNAGDVDVIDNAEELSACAWLYHDDLDDDDTIFDKSDGSWGVTFRRDDVGSSGRTDMYRIYIFESGESPAYIESKTNSSPAQTWTHVCFTFKKESSTGLRLYVNGEEDENSPADVSAIDNIANAADLEIGYNSSSGYHFDGQIDDVQIFNYALTDEQVKNVYNDGAVSFK